MTIRPSSNKLLDERETRPQLQMKLRKRERSQHTLHNEIIYKYSIATKLELTL